MVSKVTVIGFGMGNPALLTVAAQGELARSELVIASPRLLEAARPLVAPQAELVPLVRSDQIVEALRASHAMHACVLMSGDVGFYSGATGLLDQLGDWDTTVIPGISTLSYLCAKLRTPWQDAYVVSAHGRAHDLAGTVQSHAKTFALAGGDQDASTLCAQLVARGLGAVRVRVGEWLSYPQERIVEGTAQELASRSFEPLAALLIENDHPLTAVGAPRLPDDAFVRGKVPITKEEVRELAICKLRIRPDDVIWDVGAGTGSISVEAARAAYAGQVFAVERKPEACCLIEHNRDAFRLTNLTVVAGEAPMALAGLPAPDRVFVGGSSGHLSEILACALAARPSVRVCLTALTLETLTRALACIEEYQLREVDIAQIAVTKARQAGESHLMLAHNPVYLISAQGPGAGGADEGVSA